MTAAVLTAAVFFFSNMNYPSHEKMPRVAA